MKHGSCKTHCCVYHGCKYQHKDCPVTTKQITQAHPCEQCDDAKQEYQDVQELQWFGMNMENG